MIFVTVGTTKFPFNRLLKLVDLAMQEKSPKELIIIQRGCSNYQFKYLNSKIFKEIPFNKMISYIKKARIVINHGGPATIFLSLKYGKNKPLVLPRLKKFNEHTDDHQKYFCSFLENQNLIKTIKKENIEKVIKNPEPLNKKIKLKPSRNLINKLTAYISC